MKTKSFRQMSGVGLLLLTTVLTTKTLGQGVVFFSNRPLPSPPERRVFMPDGTPISGAAPGTNVSPFLGQLFYQDNTGAWVAHPQVARFLTSATEAGYWVGGTRTLANAGNPVPGQTRPVNMCVAAWDGGVGTATQPVLSFDQARASGRLWGISQVFVFTEQWNMPRLPEDTYMMGFVGFVLVPQPSAIGLAIVGGTALLLWRRRSSLKRETMKPTSLRQLGSLSVLLLSVFLSTDALGQGVVWFDNRPAYLPEPPTRRIYDFNGQPISGTNYYAQLLCQDNTGAWVAHPTVARFFTSSANAGYWNGGSRTLVNAGSPAPGQSRPVQMYVVAWDAGGGTTTVPALTFDQARAQGRFWGLTQIFTYTEEWEAPRGTDDTYMKNFVGFVLIPEPSAIALAMIGAGALFLRRRRT